LTLTRQQLENTINELKQLGSIDTNRIKDEFILRISDKNEELKSLKEIIQSDRLRYDLINEEFNKNKFEISNQKNDLNKQIETINILKKESYVKLFLTRIIKC
jgi:hypothetical protein